MSKELLIPYGVSGRTLYGMLYNANGQPYNTNTPGFEAETAANWSKYWLSATEATGGTGTYTVDMPANIPAGQYAFVVRLQLSGTTSAGASPADPILSATPSPFPWDGVKEGPVDVRSFGGSVQAMNGCRAMGLAVLTCIVSNDATPTTSTFTVNTTGVPGLSTVNNFYSSPPSIAYFTSGTDATKGYRITGYTYSAGVGTFTVETMNVPPSPGDSFAILGHG